MRKTTMDKQNMNSEQEQDLKQDADDQAQEADGKKTPDQAQEEPKTEDDGQKSESPDDADQKETSAEDAEDQNEKYIRLMADFQNYKRRVEKEKSEIYDYANQKILAELLTVLDNFERALAQECADEAYEKGMEMIFKQFREVLEKSGLEEIEAQGKEFDPNFHHAVMTDSSEEYESGQVTDVLQKGYTLHGKVVRPAMVKVNQ